MENRDKNTICQETTHQVPIGVLAGKQPPVVIAASIDNQ